MVRVRFAPSPTGYVHIGSLRTALYNFLYAKKNNGKYILRIEDTDRSRYVEGSVENLINCMLKTGLSHDEGPFIIDNTIEQRGSYGPYVQSERLDLYKKYIDQLIENGWAYYCFCTKERLDNVREEQKQKGETPRYDGFCKNLSKEEIKSNINEGIPYVIRLKLPEDSIISFNDIVRGPIEINTNDLDDQVLIKSDGYPTYHFAVVIDDHEMKISHIIRGEEWLPSTPKHIILYKALGWDIPEYIHLPNILNDDKKKLSKRQGDVAVEDFLKKGYLPEALINFIALLGWSPEGEEEIMSMEELIDNFDISRVNKSGAVFDRNKLNWMNAHYIRQMDSKNLTELCIPYLLNDNLITRNDVVERFEWIHMIVKALQEKIEYLAQITEAANVFFNDKVSEINDEEKQILSGETVPTLVEVLKEKIQLIKEISPEEMKRVFKEIQKEYKIKGKNLYMPSRIILTGQMHGPDLMMTFSILGKDKVIERLDEYTKLI